MKFRKLFFENDKYKSLTVIAIAFICVVTLLSLVGKDPDNPSDQNYNDYLIASGQYDLLDYYYINMISEDPTNVELYRTFVIEHFKIPEIRFTHTYTLERENSNLHLLLLEKIESSDIIQRDLGYFGLGQFFAEQEMLDHALERYDSVKNKKLKYLNLGIGECLYKKGEFRSSEYFFLEEINCNGDLQTAYSFLIDIYLIQKDFSKINNFIQDKKIEYFSKHQLSQYYYLTKNYSHYIFLTYSFPFQHFHLLTFLSALMIVLIWLFYLQKLDVFEPEKWSNLILVFISSAILTPNVLFFYDFINIHLNFNLNGGFLNDLAYTIFSIGFIEESIKMVPFLLFIKIFKKTSTPIDYIIYASVSALGFAFIENMMYFDTYGLELIHGRGLVSVVLHMICSSIIGYGISIGFTQNRNFIFKFLLSIFIASSVHGVFNFWLLSKTYSIFFFVSIIIFIFSVAIWNTMINNAVNLSIPSKGDTSRLNIKKIQNYLIIALSGLLMIEYILISIQMGPTIGRVQFISSIFKGSYLIIFLSATLSSFYFKRNRKERFLSTDSDLRLEIDNHYSFVYHSAKKYDIFPCSGVIIAQKMINYENNWYLVLLDHPIENYEVCSNYVLIQILKTYRIQNEDGFVEFTIIAGLFMIKQNAIILEPKIKRNDLYFCSWVKLEEILNA